MNEMEKLRRLLSKAAQIAYKEQGRLLHDADHDKEHAISKIIDGIDRACCNLYS